MFSLFKPFTVLGNYSHTQDIIGFNTSPEQCYDIVFPQFLPPSKFVDCQCVYGMGRRGNKCLKKKNVSIKCRSHKF